MPLNNPFARSEEGGSTLHAVKMNYVNSCFSASAKCADDVTKHGIIVLLAINIPKLATREIVFHRFCLEN